ncbi:MAG: hypothetical protein IMZ50_03955 [Candidatus Atribacteria bacterium]|nr:hypothetical protein [Candidatus Atribacteria bacterium]
MTEAERSIIVDYIDLFATPAGKRVLEDMKKRAGFYGTKVKKGLPIEQTRLIWNEAQRAFVLETMNRAEYDLTQEPAEEKDNG